MSKRKPKPKAETPAKTTKKPTPCRKCGSTERTPSRNCAPCKRIADRRRRRKAKHATTRGSRHLFIPDIQAKKGVPLNHIYWAAMYAMDKEVDTVIMAGDTYDFPSLSSYDKRGSKAVEGRRLVQDLDAGDLVLDILGEQWDKRGFKPRKIVTLGNHEKRLINAINESPHLLEGIVRDLKFREWGWEEYRFLQPVTVDGIRYCHFFPHSANGAVCQTKRGAPTARAQVQRQMCSATAGHQQGYDIAVIPTTEGFQRGLIAGSFYLHDEDYMGDLNHYWRGMILKNNVRNGDYSICDVDMPFLQNKYTRLEPKGPKVA